MDLQNLLKSNNKTSAHLIQVKMLSLSTYLKVLKNYLFLKHMMKMRILFQLFGQVVLITQAVTCLDAIQ